MICDIWLSYSILSTLCKITDPNQLSLSRSPSASVGGSCLLLHYVWRKRQHSKHNMGADDENECNQSTFGRMLNACAHTPAHIGVLWWFMCDREWFSVYFFLTSFIMYMRVFGPCLHTFFFIQFNLLFYLLPSRFLWIWSLATVFSWQRFLVVVSCCIYLTLYHFWCFSVVALSLSAFCFSI